MRTFEDLAREAMGIELDVAEYADRESRRRPDGPERKELSERPRPVAQALLDETRLQILHSIAVRQGHRNGSADLRSAFAHIRQIEHSDTQRRRFGLLIEDEDWRDLMARLRGEFIRDVMAALTREMAKRREAFLKPDEGPHRLRAIIHERLRVAA